MNRPFTALLAFLDALLVPALGLGILLVPLTVLWATQFELGVDYASFWRVAANFWLLGNGVDLLLVVDPGLAARLALEGAGLPFEIGFAPLGIALLTLLLGRRSGVRLSTTPYRLPGAVLGIVTVGVLGGIVGISAQSDAAHPSPTQSVVFPALLYAVGIATSLYSQAGSRREAIPEPRLIGVERWVKERLDLVPEGVLPLAAIAFRGGAVAVAALLAVAGIVVAITILGHYAEIITLYESLQAGLGGGIALTVGQLAVVPNVVIWTASWLTGSGFTLGTGSAVSPIATQLGLVPALPILGALPHSPFPLGLVAVVVPVLAGFAAGILMRPRFTRAAALRSPVPSGLRLLATGVGIGIVGATILCVLASWSGGAAGPGRLVDVGPNPGIVWLCSAVELGVSAILGLTVGLTQRSPQPSPSTVGSGSVREANKL